MYGLASDNVLEYELVLPTGSIVHVNAASHPDLFFGLRGGFNNLVSQMTPSCPYSQDRYFSRA
jgi:FAD/FMN-containing dehydrogenase